MSTDPTPDTHLRGSAEIEEQLRRLLRDRQSILEELEPRALPGEDPVAFQAAAAHRRVIAQITDALDRLNAGSYGKCVRCGQPIAPGRLEAIPHASACITCQTHAEAA